MDILERVKELCKSRGVSVKRLEEILEIPKNTIYQWKRILPSLDKVQKIADYFNVSTDYLLGRTDEKETSKPYYALTEKDERDIARDLERMLSDLESKEALAFNGEPMDEETKRLFAISLENSLRLAKEMAKKKFTPNKYRE